MEVVNEESWKFVKLISLRQIWLKFAKIVKSINIHSIWRNFLKFDIFLTMYISEHEWKLFTKDSTWSNVDLNTITYLELTSFSDISCLAISIPSSFPMIVNPGWSLLPGSIVVPEISIISLSTTRCLPITWPFNATGTGTKVTSDASIVFSPWYQINLKNI